MSGKEKSKQEQKEQQTTALPSAGQSLPPARQSPKQTPQRASEQQPQKPTRTASPKDKDKKRGPRWKRDYDRYYGKPDKKPKKDFDAADSEEELVELPEEKDDSSKIASAPGVGATVDSKETSNKVREKEHSPATPPVTRPFLADETPTQIFITPGDNKPDERLVYVRLQHNSDWGNDYDAYSICLVLIAEFQRICYIAEEKWTLADSQIARLVQDLINEIVDTPQAGALPLSEKAKLIHKDSYTKKILEFNLPSPIPNLINTYNDYRLFYEDSLLGKMANILQARCKKIKEEAEKEVEQNGGKIPDNVSVLQQAIRQYDDERQIKKMVEELVAQCQQTRQELRKQQIIKIPSDFCVLEYVIVRCGQLQVREIVTALIGQCQKIREESQQLNNGISKDFIELEKIVFKYVSKLEEDPQIQFFTYSAIKESKSTKTIEESNKGKPAKTPRSGPQEWGFLKRVYVRTKAAYRGVVFSKVKDMRQAMQERSENIPDNDSGEEESENYATEVATSPIYTLRPGILPIYIGRYSEGSVGLLPLFADPNDIRRRFPMPISKRVIDYIGEKRLKEFAKHVPITPEMAITDTEIMAILRVAVGKSKARVREEAKAKKGGKTLSDQQLEQLTQLNEFIESQIKPEGFKWDAFLRELEAKLNQVPEAQDAKLKQVPEAQSDKLRYIKKNFPDIAAALCFIELREDASAAVRWEQQLKNYFPEAQSMSKSDKKDEKNPQPPQNQKLQQGQPSPQDQKLQQGQSGGAPKPPVPTQPLVQQPQAQQMLGQTSTVPQPQPQQQQQPLQSQQQQRGGVGGTQRPNVPQPPTQDIKKEKPVQEGGSEPELLHSQMKQEQKGGQNVVENANPRGDIYDQDGEELTGQAPDTDANDYNKRDLSFWIPPSQSASGALKPLLEEDAKKTLPKTPRIARVFTAEKTPTELLIEPVAEKPDQKIIYTKIQHSGGKDEYGAYAMCLVLIAECQRIYSEQRVKIEDEIILQLIQRVIEKIVKAAYEKTGLTDRYDAEDEWAGTQRKSRYEIIRDFNLVRDRSPKENTLLDEMAKTLTKECENTSQAWKKHGKAFNKFEVLLATVQYLAGWFVQETGETESAMNIHAIMYDKTLSSVGTSFRDRWTWARAAWKLKGVPRTSSPNMRGEEKQTAGKVEGETAALLYDEGAPDVVPMPIARNVDGQTVGLLSLFVNPLDSRFPQPISDSVIKAIGGEKNLREFARQVPITSERVVTDAERVAILKVALKMPSPKADAKTPNDAGREKVLQAIKSQLPKQAQAQDEELFDWDDFSAALNNALDQVEEIKNGRKKISYIKEKFPGLFAALYFMGLRQDATLNWEQELENNFSTALAAMGNESSKEGAKSLQSLRDQQTLQSQKLRQDQLVRTLGSQAPSQTPVVPQQQQQQSQQPQATPPNNQAGSQGLPNDPSSVGLLGASSTLGTSIKEKIVDDRAPVENKGIVKLLKTGIPATQLHQSSASGKKSKSRKKSRQPEAKQVFDVTRTPTQLYDWSLPFQGGERQAVYAELQHSGSDDDYGAHAVCLNLIAEYQRVQLLKKHNQPLEPRDAAIEQAMEKLIAGAADKRIEYRDGLRDMAKGMGARGVGRGIDKEAMKNLYVAGSKKAIAGFNLSAPNDERDYLLKSLTEPLIAACKDKGGLQQGIDALLGPKIKVAIHTAGDMPATPPDARSDEGIRHSYLMQGVMM